MTVGTAQYGQRAMAEPSTRPAGRRGGGRTDETRDALLAAAHDLLATGGPGALTVRRIAAAAGVSTMNVYSRFGGKDGVIDELFIDGFARLGAGMAETPTTDDPLTDLLACGQSYRRFARDNPTYYSLMFDRAVPDFRPSQPALDAALAALGRVEARVRRAMDAGAIEEGDAFVVAAALWACDHGLASLAARDPSGKDDVFDWDRIGAVAIGALVRGLAATP